MKFLKVLFLKHILKRRMIEAINSFGETSVHPLIFDESGRATIPSGAMLDNAKQKRGEFRKGKNSNDMVFWSDI